MSTSDYRVRNWREYNKSLIHRGSLTLWIDESACHQWYADNIHPHRGRPFTYSDIAIQTCLTLKHLYRLSLRACQGFTQSIFTLMNVSQHVPSYTQLCRRQASVSLPPLPNHHEPIHLVIDSSGLKLFGEGEWLVKQHGPSKHRMWRKLHLGLDEHSKLIVCAELTDNRSSDANRLPSLLNRYPGPLKQVSADGAYDAHLCFDAIHQRRAIPTIPTQPNPFHKPKSKDQLKSPRDQVAFDIQLKGRATWKKESGYHRRSLVENAFYRYKQCLSRSLSARTLPNQHSEILIGCHILNRFTSLGLPRYALGSS